MLPALQRLSQNTQAAVAKTPDGECAARSGAGADARACAAGGRAGRSLRAAPAHRHGMPLWRRALSGAEPSIAARRRSSGRDTGAPHRPHRARPRRSVASRSAGAGRSRPDARHGVHRRRRAHLRIDARHAPDGAVLRHVRRRDRPAGRETDPRSGARRRARRAGRAARDRAARAFRRRPFAQIPDARPSARRRRHAAEHRVHRPPSATPRRSPSSCRAKATRRPRCMAT